MPASEIDDIFASKGKGKGKALPPPDPFPANPSESKRKKKKKAKKGGEDEQKVAGKRKREDCDSEPANEKHPKRKVPETIVDPSSRLAAPSKSKSRSDATGQPRPSKRSRTENQDEQRFKDSRGTGPRRTTEEGFLIYKEDELGITGQGGDTPLCPFDCDCCF